MNLSMDKKEFEQFYRRPAVVGETFRIQAGAPGIGYTTYEIRIVGDHRVYYRDIDSNIREMTIADVI